jgi:hypothetical protein
LQVWAGRTSARFFAPAKPGADAAGLAFDALTAARADGLDLLLVDTAGRLHNKSALMEELRKIIRVIKRVDEAAPHSVLLVLDATTGQNAVQQVKVFKEMVDVTGLAAAAGLFVVPAFAAVQAWSRQERRARVIAGVNIVSSLYMAGATLVTALLQSSLVGLGEPVLLAALGLLNLIAAVIFWRSFAKLA